jgi:hypothetical protein
MPLFNVFTVSLRPEKARSYQDGVRKLAERARSKKDAFHWTAHQPIAGELGLLHFVSRVDDWKGLAARDQTPEAFLVRLLGEQEGARLAEELVSCTTAARTTISRDRPDLSYPAEDGAGPAPLAVVTRLRARSGQQDACEELIRKIAEAIPKVDDPARLITRQALTGDLRTYWTIRPLADLAELDRQSVPNDLLVRAFGAGEGGLILRNGLEAMEDVERSIVVLRADLSNPPS